MKDVIITIKGTQDVDGEKEVVELTTLGKLGERDGKWYITYKDDAFADSVTSGGGTAGDPYDSGPYEYGRSSDPDYDPDDAEAAEEDLRRAAREDVTTMLKIEKNNRVTMQRMGGLRSRLTVEKGQRHMSHYDTGYGELMVGVFGEQIQSQIGSKGGRLYMRYTIDVNHSLVSHNQVEIFVKEAGEAACPC